MILAVVGLKREAKIVAGNGVRAVIGGGDAAGLDRQLEEIWRQDPDGIDGLMSFGLAGALEKSLYPGDLIIGDCVIVGDETLICDYDWTDQISARMPDHVLIGPVAGSTTMVTDPAAKAELNAESGALAVDMESLVVARFAARHGLPFTILRAISDSADQTLPPAVLVGMKSDGGMALGAVLGALARKPRQLPALIRTGREAEKGFAALLRGNDLLGPGLGKLGHLPLDVV
jgi:adenosylhomocysteine nucleosidase